MERLNSAEGHCPLAGDARAQRGVPVGLSGLGEPDVGVGELGDGGAGLVGSAAGDAVLPLVFDHGSQASRSMTTIPFGSPLRSCWKNSTKNLPEPASRMFGKNSQPNSAFLSRAAG